MSRDAPNAERKPRRQAALAWDDPVDRLAGLGAAGRAALAKSGVRTVGDVAWIVPSAFDDLRAPMGVADAVARAAAADPLEPPPRLCVHGVVTSAGLVPMRGRRAVRVVIADGAGSKPTIQAWWFFAAHGVLATAKVGAEVLLVGRVRVEGTKPARVAHGDLVADTPATRVVRARYPRSGVGEAALRGAIADALSRAQIADPVPHAIAAREAMPAIDAALRAVHGLGAPPSEGDRATVVERLAWVEAFAHVRDRLGARDDRAPALARDATATTRLVAELGFAPTAAQARAIDEIASDLASTKPMRRLLMGDVGSGKTAVALAAAAQCVAAGAQVAILAPTSVLAEQYMDAAAPLARATGAAIALVTAGMPAARRRRVEEQIARGAVAVAIGTHALLSSGVEPSRLGLVIVDEQHRLGVAQRLALARKGAGAAHLLTLSATPIPRTLALALRGELATSTLDERPRGREPVATELVARSRIGEALDDVRAACARGERAFFIAPRIEDDDDALGAKQRAEELAARFAPATVALLHGGMNADAKRAAMRAFRAGDAQVLVATTVVEVGVDVPEATRIVVDAAERFGLAQLHQLRGRVGRGARGGRCALVHDDDLAPAARRRLEALRDLSDGAAIARADLDLRGAGDLGGTRQSGASSELLFLDPAAPPGWIARVEDDARAILAADPELARPEHRALALALARFDVALAVREEAG